MKAAAPASERDLWGALPLLLPILGFYVPAAVWIGSLTYGTDAPGSAPALEAGGWGRVVASTLAVAGGGALIAGVLGGLQGFLLESFSVRGRRWLTPLLLLPFLLPTPVVTAAVFGAAASAVPGLLSEKHCVAAFINGVQMAPIVMWGVARALLAVPAAERDALRVQLSPGRAAWAVLLPRVLPIAAAMTLLVFLLLLPSMEVASYTGVPSVFGLQVNAVFTALRDDSLGWLLVALNALLVLPLLAVAARALSGAAPRPLGLEQPWDRDGTSFLPTLFLWGVAALGALALGRVAVDAGSPPWAGSGIWLGGIEARDGGVCWEVPRALLLALASALLGWRIALTGSRWGAVIFGLPLFFPESLPGLVLLEAAPKLGLPMWMLDTPFLLSVGQAVRFGGIALILGRIAVLSVPQLERDSAQGLPPRRRRLRVLLPRALPALATTTLIIAAMILAEVESAALLTPPGYRIPAVQLSQFLHFRYDENAAQLALVTTAVSLTAAVLLSRWGRGLR